jgi:geranylgeranyl pyrophosphate synthase
MATLAVDAPVDEVAERVAAVLDSAPITSLYRSSLAAALALPGNILSATPNGRWSRPVWACCTAAGGGREGAVPVAAAVEIFMVALDVLDDEEDGEENDLRATLGPARTVNASTGLLLLAQRALMDTPGCATALLILLDGGLRACAGQHADLGERESVITLEESLAVTAGKSASLVAATCRLGAFSAGADVATQELYARFGWHVGMAAQVTNDISALHADATYKTDIARGRPTLPLIYAILRGSIRPEFSEDDARRALWRGGGVYLAWAVADAYRRRAMGLIPRLTRDRVSQGELARLLPTLR